MIFIWHFLTDVATLKLNKDIYTKIETLPLPNKEPQQLSVWMRVGAFTFLFV